MEMRLFLDKNSVINYKSISQKIRVLTENWVGQYIFCPNCGNKSIFKHPNNHPATDFYCPNCHENYELKSKQNIFGSKILGGAYRTMIERLRSNDKPNFFLLNYTLTNFEIINFLVIPKHFFIPKIIEKRKPLSATARRSGWTGCNIILKNIPQSGKIFFIHNKQIEDPKNVIANWKRTSFLKEENEISAKGWLLDIMNCIDKIGKKEFKLDELYYFENKLSKLHPKNQHIKDKIRQQLQILRDKGYLEFLSQGYYRLS